MRRLRQVWVSFFLVYRISWCPLWEDEAWKKEVIRLIIIIRQRKKEEEKECNESTHTKSMINLRWWRLSFFVTEKRSLSSFSCFDTHVVSLEFFFHVSASETSYPLFFLLFTNTFEGDIHSLYIFISIFISRRQIFVPSRLSFSSLLLVLFL